MKIAFVISSLGLGGAERVASILANQWSNLGHEVTFYFVHDVEKISYSISPSIVLKRMRKKNKSGYLSTIRALSKEVKRDGADVIVSFMATPSFYAYFASRKSKTPLVCSERNNPVLYPASKIKRFIRKMVFKKAKAVVFQTNDARDFFNKKIKNKGYIISNPCDTTSMPNRHKDYEKVVVSAGRLDDQKDFPTLINGFKIFHDSHPDYKLKIYGDGVEENSLKKLIKEKSMSEFAEILPYTSEIKNIVSKAFVFVSSSKYEGMPNAVLEALAIGTPVIATDCPIGGTRILMEGNNWGKMFAAGNSEELANCLDDIANNYNNYYNGAIEFSDVIKQRLDSTKIAKEWINLFEKVLKNE